MVILPRKLILLCQPLTQFRQLHLVTRCYEYRNYTSDVGQHSYDDQKYYMNNMYVICKKGWCNGLSREHNLIYNDSWQETVEIIQNQDKSTA